MSSAIKPAQPPVTASQPAGQASPAKTFPNPQNSHLQLVGQNLAVNQTLSNQNSQQNLGHAVPMSPVSQNMAQMAQNMSHHGNLSHINQSLVAGAAIPGKPIVGAPLSLVQDKMTPPQPLALTRTPEKKDEIPLQANGTSESPKSLQPPLTNEKTPPAKPIQENAPKTLNKLEESTAPKVEAPIAAPEPSNEKDESKIESPAKPTEKIEAKTPEAPKLPEKPKEEAILQKEAVPPKLEEQKSVTPPKVEQQKIEEVKLVPAEALVVPVAPTTKDEKADDKVKVQEPSKQPEQKLAESAETPKAPVPTKAGKQATPKPAAKAPATPAPAPRKRKQESKSPAKAQDGPTPAKKPAEDEAAATPSNRGKRNRTKVQPYQSPTPELTMATKLSASQDRATPTKSVDDKLIVFYKNEYLAVRNAEGGFYICQTMQNVYRSTKKIKIRWLSQDKTADPSGETYRPDFYDTTDMECVLTTLSMKRGSNGTQILRGSEAARAASILQRALLAESGSAPQLSETHPDGLDLSLYKDESQLEVRKSGTQRKRSTSKSDGTSSSSGESTPTPAKRRKKAVKKAKPKAETGKKKPEVATSTGKSAAVTLTIQPKAKTPAKKVVATPPPPVVKKTPTRATKAEPTPTPPPPPKAKVTPKRNEKAKAVQQPTPSTSTGKATRTPRKPPAKK